MQVSTKKALTKAALVLGGTVALMFFLLTSHGFCWSQFRFPSDYELIYLAIEKNQYYNNMEIGGSAIEINEFIKKHPGCCRIDRSPERSFLDALFGFNTFNVTIYHPYIENGLRTDAYYEAVMSINNCGRTIRLYGDRMKKTDLPLGAE